MKINKPKLKQILHYCFLVKNINGMLEERRFKLDKLIDAGLAFKKLTSCIDKEKGVFNKEEIDFTASETELIKTIFDEKLNTEGFPASESENIQELKSLFMPK